MKKIINSFVLLCLASFAFAQEANLEENTFNDEVAFELQKEFYIFGDVTAIGNNILSEDNKDDFNKPQEDNDNIKMQYVDIDKDKLTFNSSQATLKLPENFKKIAYAGLYWTATYAYDRGTRREKRGKYVYQGNGERSSYINKIKFKLPNQEYQDVTGNLVFDGYKNKTHAANAPYVCYADVTKLLKEAEATSGDYVVANIKATQGYLSGGSAAGWMLYIVYQSPTDNPKYISTYHGFTQVDGTKPVDITFENFKAVEQGDVKTSVVVSALEGDASSEGDDFAIIKQRDKRFQSLSNGARYQQNFFNSSITKNSLLYTDRLPKSQNTLGFDIAELDIPNYNNIIINNNTNKTTIRLKTKEDKFYLYFTAFQTEIKQTYFNDAVQGKNSNTSSKTYVLPEIVRSEPSTVPSYNTKEKRKPYRYFKKGLNSNSFNYLKNKESTAIAGIEGGYYVVTGVFAEAPRAGKWTANLIKKGFKANTFINPKNNWNYVYVKLSDTPEEAFKLMEELKTNYRYRDAWILKANLD